MVPVAVVKRYAKFVFLAAVFSLLLTYLGDYAIVRLRSAEKRSDLFGGVEVMTAATMKNGRVEIYSNPKPEVCCTPCFPTWATNHAGTSTRSPIKLIGSSPGPPSVKRGALLGCIFPIG